MRPTKKAVRRECVLQKKAVRRECVLPKWRCVESAYYYQKYTCRTYIRWGKKWCAVNVTDPAPVRAVPV